MSTTKRARGDARHETVNLEVADGVARIELNRPDSLNAWTVQLGADLLAAVDSAGGDPAVRAVLITGAGRAFSAGADLKQDASVTADGHPDVLTPLRTFYNPIIAGVRRMPKPVVAAVNGPAAGIGCSLALACDLVLASESAYFLLAFVKVALTLDGGASATLAARIGPARAAELAMLGERLEARRALEWGLVNAVHPDGELMGAADELVRRLAAGPTASYAATKRLLNERLYAGLEDHLDLEARLQQERASSADFTEGVLAFFQKRPPDFTGA
jgi:2-(1,2-epoxy-1,2-dihydrophenyl)acetyl-CoA isomerase